ncbi:MAG: xanthine dehydrogenase family protein molybdopterin-binding subunit [Actinomycetota bacterium]
MAASGSILGNSVRRKEDPTLLTGEGKYFDDMEAEGMAHVHFVRSTAAHARIEGIDISEATGMPGVIAVHTAESMPLPPMPGMPGVIPDEMSRPPLAVGKVRFVGDIVAVVIAETKEQAVDAAEAVIVDYDFLPAVTDGAAALADDAPVIFEEHGSNIAFNMFQAPQDEGALDGADAVAELEMLSQRLAGVPMENNGLLALPGDGEITVYVSHQAPHALHGALAPMLGMEPENVRVIAPWVGGGFGPKAAVYVEYIITSAAAVALGRPVKWTESRSEDMLSLVHGRDLRMTGKLGVTNDGKITGLEIHVVAAGGAYPAIGAFLPQLTLMMSQAVYDIPKIKGTAISAVTNNTPVAAYRGAGRPEATQFVERILDIAAAEIGMDPAEIRRVNYLQPEAFPLTTKTGANYDSGEYEKTLDAALEHSGYAELRGEQEARRTAGAAKQLGIGVSSYVEVTAPIGLHAEFGAVEVLEDGSATMRVGTSAHGQAHDTAFSMLVHDMLGIPMDKIKLIQSDTGEVPQGAGTMGSRSLQTAGSAVHVASENVLEKAKQLAAHLLEANVDDIEKGDDGLQVAGVPAKSLSWSELATAANDDAKRPDGMEAGLQHELVFDEGDSTFPFGSHVAVVEVDVETGGIQLLRHIAVDDCGRILNPMLVTGQQHGGIAQGAAQALFEEMQYDDEGNPVSASLMDYLMPSAAEFPSFETYNTETDSPRNPLGAKGIGESGTIGSTPAVHNAVVDALSHLGVKHIEMPATPMRIWEAVGAAQPA